MSKPANRVYVAKGSISGLAAGTYPPQPVWVNTGLAGGPAEIPWPADGIPNALDARSNSTFDQGSPPDSGARSFSFDVIWRDQAADTGVSVYRRSAATVAMRGTNAAVITYADASVDESAIIRVDPATVVLADIGDNGSTVGQILFSHPAVRTLAEIIPSGQQPDGAYASVATAEGAVIRGIDLSIGNAATADNEAEFVLYERPMRDHPTAASGEEPLIRPIAGPWVVAAPESKTIRFNGGLPTAPAADYFVAVTRVSGVAIVAVDIHAALYIERR